MLARVGREAILTGSITFVAVVSSFIIYASLPNDHTSPAPSSLVSALQEPGGVKWEPTGQYRDQHMDVGLNVHAFSITSASIAILYTLDHPVSSAQVLPKEISLTDDLGQSYDITSNTTIGSSQGVTAAILTTAPYNGQGSLLTLTLRGVEVSPPGTPGAGHLPATWSVQFMRNVEPGAPIDYTLASKVAPEVMTAGDLTIAKAGGPDVSLTALLIDRAGQQSAIYGTLSGGAGHGLTEAEFRQLLASQNIRDFPPPPAWPSHVNPP